MLQRNAPITNPIKESRFVAALFVSVGLLLLPTCSSRNNRTTVLEMSGQDEWRNGDLVFRCGMGVESRAVTAHGHSSYSHIGLLYRDTTNGQWLVIHAVPGEDEPEWLKTEPVEVFFGRDRACAGAWATVDCSDSVANKAALYALGKVAAHTLFDNTYRTADTAQLYCTELVWRSYLHAGMDVTGGKRHSVPTFFSKEGECIFPNDIEQSETTLFVKPFKTKQL